MWFFPAGMILGAALAFCIIQYIESVNKEVKVKPIEADRDMTGAFAVENTNPFWLAVHQAINELEKETIEAARKCSANPSLSNYHLGASEGVSMVRLRLIEKRGIALAEVNKKVS